MMQATSMMEAATGKGYYNNGGSLKKDKSSNPKKENSLSSSSSNEFKSTFSADEWNSLSLKQRDKDKGISNIDNMHLLQSSFAANQETNIESTHCQSSEFEDGIDYAFLNETYSIHYSESKLKNENVTLLNSDFNPGILKREENFFDSLEHQDNKTISLERILKVSDADYKENGEDMQKYDIDEDSQQEYHSAEQEYISKHLSFDQAKALSLSDLDVVELTNPGYGVRCVSNLEESCHVEFGSGSTTSLNSLNAFTQEYSPHVSKFQNSVILKEYHEPDLGRYNEQETVFDDIVQRCSSLGSQDSQSKSGFLNTQKALKTKTYTRKVKSQVSESKDFCGNTAADDRSLHHFGDPSTLPQDKSFETLQPHNNCQTYWNSVFDDSVISACGYSYYESLQSTPEPGLGFSAVLPRITINQATEEDRSLHVAHPTNKMFSHDMKGTCPKSVTNTASSAITINQAVDVSTDFRACFTTSRATSAAFSVVSTSSNTEITMMSKKRPAQRHCDSHRSVGCNTDRLRDHDCVETQTLPLEGSGKSLSPNGSFLNKDSQELKTSDAPDIKKHPEREFQLSKEIEKNLPSTCCQKIMQRAIKAEMHLLNVHYEMCHRHCCDIYKLVMENRPGLYRNLSSTSAKKELGSALLSVWGDLKVRYMNLKEKLQQGIQLEELPPLSVESKLLSTFSTFASRLMKEDSHDFLGVDSELDNQGTPDSDVSTGPKQAHSEMSLLPDNSHPKQDISPKKDDLENDDINVDFSQLKLDDKECRNYHERTEDWFDATENLTGVNFSGIQENQIENDRENLKFPLEMKNVELLQRDKGFLIHVGGLCSSVSEADLRSHFQKYQVSEISIYDSSNYRYASQIQEGIKKNCKQIESAHLLPETPVQFIPPNTLNLRSFTKIMKRLTELHPEVSRDHIIDALQEVRMTHKGFLNGLSINTIVEMTSSVLKNSASA
ncbi:PREDICTED: RNA-binding protein 44 [Dipodomys ordii]|uniref:RNA-binding protein 44 n=1 Tax=Dipodomys ordii TaxID=10020 RepID=A0A1S3FT57_DIPOR|nr:PREDICTED: RNA-binding protein 44 [Dipodomys ordii]